MPKKDSPGQSIIVTSTIPDHLNSNAIIRAFAASGLRIADPSSCVVECNIHGVSDVANRLKPDLILAIGSVAIDGGELRFLRRIADTSKAVLALWLHDDPYEFDYAFRAEDVADVLFTNDSWARLHYRHPRVLHLPLAASRAAHFREIADGQRRTEAFFCGNAHPNRVAFLRAAEPILARYDVAVVGTGWPADLTFAINQWLSPSEAADAANTSTLTFNIPRVHNIANRRFDLPASTPGPRTFEVALAGSAQIAWSSGPEMKDYLLPGSEIVYLESFRELALTLERSRDDPGYFLEIARAAQKRVLAEHCYEHRMKVVLEEVFPDHAFGRSAVDNLSSEQGDVSARLALMLRRMSRSVKPARVA